MKPFASTTLAALLLCAPAARADPPPAQRLAFAPALEADAPGAIVLHLDSSPADAPAEKKATKSPIFPLWGDKVRAKGFDLPPAWGLMVNYYYQKSAIRISNLKLGVNDSQMFDASFIKFGDAQAEANALALRPSLMVLPFLSVYGLLSVGTSSTTISVTEPVGFTTVADSNATIVALGATFQMGYKGFFGVADFNGSVADVDRIADLMGANLLSFRLGYSKKLEGPPGHSLSAWLGTAGQVIDVDTSGSVKLGDVLPPPNQGQVDSVQARCDALSPLNPAKGRCDALAAKMQDWVNGTAPDATVSYSLEKKPKDVWNALVGAQYAIDRNWMFRVEAGFLTSRASLLLGAEYRFDGP